MKILYLDDLTVVVDYNKKRYTKNAKGLWTDKFGNQVESEIHNRLETGLRALKVDFKLGEHMKYLGFSNNTEYYTLQKWVGDHRGFYQVLKVKYTYDGVPWEISETSTKIVPKEHKNDKWIRLEFDDEEYQPTFEYFRNEIIEKGILKPDEKLYYYD
ncbi:MAG: hypothetical protein JNL36_02740 [Candidatus Kapabacteria bacterium]|nr:hypothetical protein [Candidatus Kapabacteria bacterium]